jgi:glutamyl-tRNA(Gln) amidotransferase subunit E
MPAFETAVERGVDPTTAATTLESTVTKIRRRDAPVENLTDEHLLGVLDLVESGDLAKEGIGEVLTVLAEQPDLSAAEGVEEAGLSGVDEDEVREAVAEVVERNTDQVEAEGMGAFSALMGEAMGALRGKADGEVVSDVLREEIQKRA